MVIEKVFGLQNTGTSLNDRFTMWADLRTSSNVETVEPERILSLEQACQKICDILSNNEGQLGNIPQQASNFLSGRKVRARSFRFINEKRRVFGKNRILQGGIRKGFWVQETWQPRRQRLWRRSNQPNTGGMKRRYFKPSVTKEQLDAELVEYMLSSKAWLDKELDEYMSCTKSLLDKQLDEYMSKIFFDKIKIF